MADSDVIGGIENLTDAVSGETPSYEYKNPNTDMMKAISKCVDAATGKTGTEYEYDNPNTDVIQKMEELATAIASSGGGGGGSILITKTGTENKTYKAIDDSADGYSEFTVNVPTVQPTLITKSITENGTYDASDDSADGYSSVTVNVSKVPPVTQFRYFKWHITSIWGNQYFQASEFGFYDGTNLMTWPQGVVATSSLPLLELYSIANLLDGSTNTKIVTEFHSGDVEDIVIDLGSGNTVDITQYPYYYWGSSDDDESYRGRTPLKWQLFGSNVSDFSDAVLLDEVTSFTPYVKNKEMAYSGLMVSKGQEVGNPNAHELVIYHEQIETE